jgi:hypothetical protein
MPKSIIHNQGEFRRFCQLKGTGPNKKRKRWSVLSIVRKIIPGYRGLFQ